MNLPYQGRLSKRFSLGLGGQTFSVVDGLLASLCVVSFAFSWVESCVNLDSHHWGLMYLQALDLKQGLIPHKEVVIFYGYLTTWLQSLSLMLLGERLLSIGLMTGLVYALSIALFYYLCQSFLPKSLSFLAALLMFLLHAYIISPWANYFTYPFLLASLIFCLNRDRSRYPAQLTLLSGVFAGLAVLTRYTSVHVVLLPFLVFFGIQVLLERTRWKAVVLEAIAWVAGLSGIVLLFFILLASQGALGDLFLQTKTLAQAWGRGVSITNSIPQLLRSILSHTAFMARSNYDPRVWFFTINFFWCGIVLFYLLLPTQLSYGPKGEIRSQLILICLVTLFGYLNATHAYEVFRLVNGASLGILIVFYTLFHLSDNVRRISGKTLRRVLLIPLAAYYCVLGSTVIFTRTSSVYWPWDWATLRRENVAQIRMHIFAGKILPKSYYNFYRDISQTAVGLDSSYSVVNFTLDPIAAAVTKLPRVQEAATFVPELARVYPQETAKIEELIRENKALVVSPSGMEQLKSPPLSLDLGDSKMVFRQPWPEMTPWLSGIIPVPTDRPMLFVFRGEKSARAAEKTGS